MTVREIKKVCSYIFEFILDPEMLNFDVNIVSIPLCCDTNGGYDSSDDASSTCSCSRSSVSSPHHFSDMENSLAKNKAINKLIFPDQLNKSKFCILIMIYLSNF